jgi:hypothetical protein
MMLEEKITRVKKLIEQRDQIEAELAAIFGMTAPSKRGRPRKEKGSSSPESVSAGHSVSVGWSTSQSTGNGSDGE